MGLVVVNVHDVFSEAGVFEGSALCCHNRAHPGDLQHPVWMDRSANNPVTNTMSVPDNEVLMLGDDAEKEDALGEPRIYVPPCDLCFYVIICDNLYDLDCPKFCPISDLTVKKRAFLLQQLQLLARDTRALGPSSRTEIKALVGRSSTSEAETNKIVHNRYKPNTFTKGEINDR